MRHKIIDLSVAIGNRIDGVNVTLQDDLPIYLGCECYAYDLQIKSHTGTYFESNSHVFRDGKNTEQIELEKMILPGVCIRIGESDRCITADDIEAAKVRPKAGSSVLIDAGDRKDKYFSRDVAEWMIDNKVALMGSSTRLYDSGFENPTGFFIDLFKAEIPIIANLSNVNLLPVKDFTLITMPLKVEGVCTVPCRVVAYEHQTNEHTCGMPPSSRHR